MKSSFLVNFIAQHTFAEIPSFNLSPWKAFEGNLHWVDYPSLNIDRVEFGGNIFIYPVCYTRTSHVSKPYRAIKTHKLPVATFENNFSERTILKLFINFEHGTASTKTTFRQYGNFFRKQQEIVSQCLKINFIKFSDLSVARDRNLKYLRTFKIPEILLLFGLSQVERNNEGQPGVAGSSLRRMYLKASGLVSRPFIC